MSADADITNNKSRLLTQSPRIRNSLRCLLIRVARPISMCLRMQACFTTWLLSGTFIVNYYTLQIINLCSISVNSRSKIEQDPANLITYNPIILSHLSDVKIFLLSHRISFDTMQTSYLLFCNQLFILRLQYSFTCYAKRKILLLFFLIFRYFFVNLIIDK